MEWQPGPRMAAPSVPDGEVVLQPPGDAPQTLPGNPLARILPVVMLVAMAGMLVLFVRSGAAAARNPVSLLFPAMMVVSSLGMMSHGRAGAGRTAEVDEGRKDYLRYLDRVRKEVSETAQRQRKALLWQHPDPACLWTLGGTRRMWERGRADSDFCHVRVGLGGQRSAAAPSAPDLGPIDRLEPVGAMALRDFIQAHSVIAEVPIALALRRFGTVAVEGDERCARALMRAMVCQLAVLHGPQCLAITAIAGDGAAAEWDWLKWLPHQPHAETAAAHTVVVVDGGDVSAVDRRDATILVRGAAAWPPNLRLDVSADELAVIGDVREVVARADAMTVEQADLCARRLARHRQAVDGPALSSAATDWARLVQSEAVWRQRPPRNRLRVAIGAATDGSPVELDLKEAAEHGMGPHGLCVGATGAGKSEFLRALTLGLIATHDPETLNLILIDFKGGATFLGFDRARHVSAVITNLAGEAHLVARMKDAFAGEMNRRQELLRLAGQYSSVADYERARAAGAALAPLPTLVVIVDEFSELLSRHPDFAEMFAAMGRLGRSLRIHLLLATQRLDEGRLRGLDSHLSYRVCLKTFSANESRAVIGTPDAFHLPATPGAAFLKLGADEPVAFQTFYVSGPWTTPAASSSRAAAPAVRVFKRAASRSAGIEPDPAPVATGKTVLDTVLDRLAGRGTPAHRVWLPPLAESPTLDRLLGGNPGLLSVAIGVVDRPFDQRRDPLVVDLAGAAGHVAIIGAPQSGKSTTVRTLVAALAGTHTPEQVQVYCLDFGGGALSTLAAFPHVGAVAGSTDADVVRRTVAEMTRLLRKREEAFRRLGVDSMADYRSRRAAGDPSVTDDEYGDVFLVIDGWASLRGEFDALEQPITALATRGLSYGVHLVLSTSRWAEVRPALKDQMGTRIELRLGDAGESELNRRVAQHVPLGSPGRGITHEGLHMLVGLPRFDGKHEAGGLSAALADAAATLRARFGDRAAPGVRVLPGRVDHDALAAGRTGMVIGVDEDELEPVGMDFAENQHVLVLGDSGCGKTAALRVICAELVRTQTPQQAQLMIVDYRRTLLGVVESDHLAGYAVSGAVVSAALPALVEELRSRIPGPEVDQRELRARSWWSGPDIYLIVDDYDLVSTESGNPLGPIIELLPYAKDLGLHAVLARRSGGAGRALFEPMLARLRELGCLGVMMSASPEEGVLLGAARAGPLPPGRARLTCRAGERLVQLGWVAPCL
ncbi:MAG: type VII secretion protein EccCb [Mycobacterium sp.]